MKRRGLRLALVLGFVVAVAGAGYALWALEARGVAARAARAAYDAQADRAAAALVDLRAGLEAYVAAGQRVDFWAPKVAAAIEGFRNALGDMQRVAPDPEVTAALESATDLAELDSRARDLIASDQALLASDLIFSDGLEMLRAAGARLAGARAAERAAVEGTRQELTRQQTYVAAAALGVALLVVLLLLPSGAAPAAAEPASPAVGLQLSAPAAPSDADAQLAAALDAGLSGWQPKPAEPERPARPSVDLTAAAELCGDFSRLSDSTALPGLLERAAGLLGAKGLTIWVADPTGAVLYPTASHGYSPQMLARIGSLRRDDANATSLAFRTSSVQTVKGDGDQLGAIVVPLVAVAGCVGVMAAEVESRKEQDEAVSAVARIIAAQLATLIPAAPPAAAQASNA